MKFFQPQQPIAKANKAVYTPWDAVVRRCSQDGLQGSDKMYLPKAVMRFTE